VPIELHQLQKSHLVLILKLTLAKAVVNKLWAAEARWPASLLQGCQEYTKLGNKPCSSNLNFVSSVISLLLIF